MQVVDSSSMLHFQKVDVYQRSDELVGAESYAQGIELLERIVAMLTKLIDP